MSGIDAELGQELVLAGIHWTNISAAQSGAQIVACLHGCWSKLASGWAAAGQIVESFMDLNKGVPFKRFPHTLMTSQLCACCWYIKGCYVIYDAYNLTQNPAASCSKLQV